ncbi:MAG: alkaline phosphatase [Bacteroidales bacterium]
MRKVLLALSLAVIALSSCCQVAKENNKSEEVRNVIYLIGDGMGLAQASMAMVESGYDSISFDRAENIALIKTYSSNNRVTDSAAAGTALACGEKTNNGMLGLTADMDTCISMSAKASAKGKATGLVVSCTVQHATPAAFYAHVESRNSYELIAEQLVNSTIDLAIGGGESYFNKEVDGVKLIDIAQAKGFNIARNFDELEAVEDGRILALFEQGHIKSMADGRGDFLPKATVAALEILSKNENGFLLMVEGSQIDWVCHGNDAEGTLAEVMDFNDCVNIAMDFADNNPGTLVVVTADHETGGLSLVSGDADFSKADSGVNYKYATTGHSGILVPVYLYGAGADQINGIMENTQLAKEIEKILGL